MAARAMRFGFVSLLTMLILAELALRVMHICDVPLYLADDQVGYIPAPNQHGRFMRRNDWAFNEHSMGVARPFAPTPADILLLGDSVVLGGAWFPQAEKLGPRLQGVIGRTVWPLSAGSWALRNEMVAFLRWSELRTLGTVVIVSNSGDFGIPSVWRSELTHPRHHPWSDLVYVARKKWTGAQENWDPPVTPAATSAWQEGVAAFLATYHGRILWVVYPQKRELRVPSAAFSPLIERIRGRAEIIDVRADPRWNASLYQDSIHPNAKGATVLASIIADHVRAAR